MLGLLANDVFGSSTLGKIVIIAVLSSAAASCQTTILPTARTALSMARAKAIPAKLGEVDTRYLTPAFATWVMGILSVVWYVGLTIVSTNILGDAIAALGLWIAFYYGLTAFACTIYYRRQVFTSAKNFIFLGRGAGARRPDAARHPGQVVLRPLQAGELGLRRLVVRARPAARDRHQLHAARRDRHADLAHRRAIRSSSAARREVADPALVAHAPAGGATS